MARNPALALLKKDHAAVKKLFNKFEKAKGKAEKKKIVKQALLELRVHAAIEEEIFYPAVRKPVGADTMNEADEEHHVAKVLIAELDAMTGSEDHKEIRPLKRHIEGSLGNRNPIWVQIPVQGHARSVTAFLQEPEIIMPKLIQMNHL